MNSRNLILMIMVCLAGLLASCDDSFGPEYSPNYHGVVDINGNLNFVPNSQLSVYDLIISGQGVYSVKNSTIKFRSLTSTSETQLIPPNLVVRSDDFLACDKQGEKLYFCANGDLYRCNMDGTERTNLTPQNDRILYRPVISGNGQYITMISVSGNNRYLNLYNVESNELTFYDYNVSAFWGFYDQSNDKFWYFNLYGNLYTINLDGTSNVLKEYGYSYSDVIFYKSDDDSILMAVSAASQRLYAYNCQEETVKRLTALQAALSPNGREFVYSTIQHGAACLWRYDIDTNTSILINDGIRDSRIYITSYYYLVYHTDGDFLNFYCATRKRIYD